MKTFFLIIFSFFSGYCLAQSNTEIFLFNIETLGAKISLKDPVNISNNEGYDNQPSLLSDGSILYVSTRNEQTDILGYIPKNGNKIWLSTTEGGEYSPLKVPNKNEVSAVRLDKDGKQRLYTYDFINGGSKELIPEQVVAYYTWYDENTIVSANIEEDNLNLYVTNLTDGSSKKYDENVGRSFHRIPNSNFVSYISKAKEKWEIKSLDPLTGETKVICYAIPNVEDICWIDKNTVLTSMDGVLYKSNVQEKNVWSEVADLKSKGITNISRLAINKESTKLLVVGEISGTSNIPTKETTTTSSVSSSSSSSSQTSNNIRAYVKTDSTQALVIKNVNIVDVESGTIKQNKNIYIEGDIITKISSKNIKNSAKAYTIDGTGKYIIPGLIDSHIHFFQSGGLYTRPDAINLTERKSYEDEIKFAESIISENFKKYLRLGVTTVVDVGGPFSNFKVRDEIAKNNISPNVLVTGPLFSPYQPKAFSLLSDTPIAKITSIKQADSLFQKMIKYNPDFIKIWYIANNENPAKKTFPLVQNIAKLAHNNNLKLAVHATDLKTAEFAVKAGADILVHSVDNAVFTNKFIELLKKNNVSYNPTLIVSKNYIETYTSKLDLHPQDIKYANSEAYGSLFDLKIEDINIPNYMKDMRKSPDAYFRYYKFKDSISSINLKTAVKEDINVITGTDAGNIGTMHATSYIQEVEAMEEFGMKPADILKASTINAAKAFDLQDRLGTIEKNKVADLVLLNKNPLEDIQALNTISEVIKNGAVLNLDALLEENPESVVQRQVNAYNARNIDAFLDTYSDDVKIYNFPDKISYDGKDKMRKSFSDMFKNIPNLYCEIKNRIVLGNKVIDREHVRFGDDYSDVIAIYEVNNGKITKVTFLR